MQPTAQMTGDAHYELSAIHPLSQITEWFVSEDAGHTMQHRVVGVNGKRYTLVVETDMGRNLDFVKRRLWLLFK